MEKTTKAVTYMIDVWDEVTGKTWRQRPDHVQQLFLEAEAEQLRLSEVIRQSEQLCINCKEKPANRGLGEHKLLCSDCWNKLCD